MSFPRRSVSIPALIALLAFASCGGGGNVTGGAPPPSPPPSSPASPDPVRPLGLAKIPLDVGPVSAVTQTGGPPVTDLSFSGGVLTFVAPPETGQGETLDFRIGLQDGSSLPLSVRMESLLPPVVGDLHDEPTEGEPVAWSDLEMTVPSFVDVNVLPANYAGFTLRFSSTGGAKPARTFITLQNGFRSWRVTELFIVDASTGDVSLDPARKADFQAKLTDRPLELTVAGEDDRGRQFAFTVSFRYGSNEVRGRLVDGLGRTVTSLAGKTVLLDGLNSGIRRGANVLADGTFSFANVVCDSFAISLVDPSLAVHGSSLFFIEWGGKIVTVDLPVSGATITAAPGSLSTAKARPAFAASVDAGLPPFARNRPIEPRIGPGPGLSSILPQAPVATENSVLVTGYVKDNVVRMEKQIVVPRLTGKVKIRASVSTAEYPNWTTQASPFNDTWGYWWWCGTEYQVRDGAVNNTHADAGSHSWEWDVDLSALTRTAPVTCTIGAQTVNIGDGGYPTTVSVSLAESTGITIKSVSHVSGLWKDPRANCYSLGIPITGNYGIHRPFTVEVRYSPKDAVITRMATELQYGGERWNVDADQKFTPVGTDNGTVSAVITMPPVPVVPAESGVPKASLLVTLEGTLKGQTVKRVSNASPLRFSDAAVSDAFHPLFEIRDLVTLPASRRYHSDSLQPRNDDSGGDGWGRADMLSWLTSGTGGSSWMNLRFNDISGENAWQKYVPGSGNNRGGMLSMGVHRAHKGGYDTDARYWDENGAFETEMRGDGGGRAIAEAVAAALPEVAAGDVSGYPNLRKVIGWVKANRSGLENLAADASVYQVYIGQGDWFLGSLVYGLLKQQGPPNPTWVPIPDVTLPRSGTDNAYPLLGPWTNAPDSVVVIDDNHNSHMHLRLWPDPNKK